MSIKALGQEGFTWFIGVVEERNDPLKLGRVRVRVYNFHPSDKSLVPTDQLPWALIMLPPVHPSHQQIGLSPVGLTIGSTVLGFFMDGNDGNQPVVIGTMHGIPDNNIQKHDVSLLAREINDIEKDKDAYEPETAYEAKYPFNKVLKTESGHVVEIDDTPGKERIHLYHKSGTYTEINKDGRRVDKTVDKHFEIIFSDETIHIRGNQEVKIDGNVNILVDGTYTLESKGNMLIKAPRIDFNP